MAGVKGMHKRQSTSAAYAEAVRARIRAGGIAKLLEDHVAGKREMTSTQVTAALGLLKKVVPDQQHMTHANDPENPLTPLVGAADELRKSLRSG